MPQDRDIGQCLRTSRNINKVLNGSAEPPSIRALTWSVQHFSGSFQILEMVSANPVNGSTAACPAPAVRGAAGVPAGGRTEIMANISEAEAAAPEPVVWTLNLGRRGLEVKAGRHLHVSLSRTLLFWLVSVAGTASTSPYWTTLIS